jgi:hypothetical protein
MAVEFNPFNQEVGSREYTEDFGKCIDSQDRHRIERFSEGIIAFPNNLNEMALVVLSPNGVIYDKAAVNKGINSHDEGPVDVFIASDGSQHKLAPPLSVVYVTLSGEASVSEQLFTEADRLVDSLVRQGDSSDREDIAFRKDLYLKTLPKIIGKI